MYINGIKKSTWVKRRMTSKEVPVVTFSSPHRTDDLNETYRLVRLEYLRLAMRHGLLPLYEMIALGLSGTDIGDCVDASLLVEAISLDSPEFVQASLDNLKGSVAEDESTWMRVRSALHSLAQTSPSGPLLTILVNNKVLQSELRVEHFP